MLNVRLAGDHLYGKLLFTWLSLVMSMMVSFCAVFFPTRCLGWDLELNWVSFWGFSFLLWKALQKMCFQSDIIFRHYVKMPPTKFWKHPTKFMISMSLSEIFGCQNLIPIIKVINTTGHSSPILLKSQYLKKRWIYLGQIWSEWSLIWTVWN